MTTVDLTGLSPEMAYQLGQLTVELVAEAEQRGYQRAIQILRDDERYRDWWSTLPPGSPDVYWHGPGRRHLADYLETIDEPLPRACRSAERASATDSAMT